MGLPYLFGLCLALLSFSSLAAGLVEHGFKPPLNLGTISAGGINGSRVTATSTGSLTSVQPRIGAVSVDMVFKRGLSNQGATLFARRALFASPAVFASLGVGSLILERNGYTWSDGGFVKIPTDPANRAFWGVAPIGVTYSYRGSSHDNLFDALSESVAEGYGCDTGSCVLTGVAQNYMQCIQLLNPQCAVKPSVTRNGNPYSSGYFGTVVVYNTSGEINCAGDTVYSVEHYGCYAFDGGAAVDLDAVAGDIDPEDIADLSDEEVAGLVIGAIDGGIASNDDFWPDDDLIDIEIVPASIEFDLGSTITTQFIPPNNEQVVVTSETALVEFDSPVYAPSPYSSSASDVLERPLPLQVMSTTKPVVGTVTLPSTETITSKTYEDGALTSTSSTTNAGSNPISRPATGTGAGAGAGEGAGSGSSSGSGFELPSFCSWATVVCDWLDWTREPADPEPDLSAILTDEDFEQSYNISFGSSSCPEPISLNIAFLNKNIDLSYEPVCELAGYAKPLVLISAYIFAIYIGLGVVRNG